MFSRLVSATTLLCAAVLATATPTRRTDHAIISPSEGSAIAPGQTFDFDYRGMGDYGISSYNITVWLFTSPPTSFAPSENFATGYFFGRYAYSTYPTDPYPSNPPPSQLVMPNFSDAPGGFGTGETAFNQSCYFVVLEEYGTFDPTLGSNIALTSNQIYYNGTVSSSNSTSD